MTLDTILYLLFTGLSIFLAHKEGALPKLLSLLSGWFKPKNPSPPPNVSPSLWEALKRLLDELIQKKQEVKLTEKVIQDYQKEN